MDIGGDLVVHKAIIASNSIQPFKVKVLIGVVTLSAEAAYLIHFLVS